MITLTSSRVHGPALVESTLPVHDHQYPSAQLGKIVDSLYPVQFKGELVAKGPQGSPEAPLRWSLNPWPLDVTTELV